MHTWTLRMECTGQNKICSFVPLKFTDLILKALSQVSSLLSSALPLVSPRRAVSLSTPGQPPLTAQECTYSTLSVHGKSSLIIMRKTKCTIVVYNLCLWPLFCTPPPCLSWFTTGVFFRGNCLSNPLDERQVMSKRKMVWRQNILFRQSLSILGLLFDFLKSPTPNRCS